MSQAGSQAPLQHIHAEFADIKSRNEAQQARVEDILSQRLALEQQAKQVNDTGSGGTECLTLQWRHRAFSDAASQYAPSKDSYRQTTSHVFGLRSV